MSKAAGPTAGPGPAAAANDTVPGTSDQANSGPRKESDSKKSSKLSSDEKDGE